MRALPALWILLAAAPAAAGRQEREAKAIRYAQGQMRDDLVRAGKKAARFSPAVQAAVARTGRMIEQEITGPGVRGGDWMLSQRLDRFDAQGRRLGGAETASGGVFRRVWVAAEHGREGVTVAITGGARIGKAIVRTGGPEGRTRRTERNLFGWRRTHVRGEPATWSRR